MRVLLSVVGTRGDVQPVLALACRLREHGHQLHLAIPPNFTSWAAELGLTATAVGVEMRAPQPGAAATPARDLIADQFESVQRAAKNCDVILGANAHQYAAASIAEWRGVPYVNALYAPTALPTKENVRAWNERARDRVNANRARLGLSPVDDVLRHIVTDRPWLATDPVLSPAPPDANTMIVQTGAWIFEDTQPLPDRLNDFLDAGEPPVYVGFGSMPVAAGMNRVLIEGARAAGRRVIVARGWGGLARIDEASDCIEIDEVNHGALFRRVAMVVHHGGAGTTHAALRAAVPQVIIPMFSDQPYWSRRVQELGVGASVPPSELSGERLALALDALDQAGVRERVAGLAPTMIADGVNVAALRLAALAR